MKHLKEALFGAYKECTADERDGVFYTNDEADDQALQSVAKDMYIERLEKEKKALSAENAHLTGQLAEARAKIAAAESSDQAAELADLRDYVQRLKIANAELKNKAKGLPKNHSGYEVTVFNNKIKVPYEDTFTITDEKTKKSKKITKIKYATVYETVLQTPFPWSHPLEAFRRDCFSQFMTMTDVNGDTILAKLGLKFDLFKQYKYGSWTNFSMWDGNYVLDYTFRGGRSGYWEIAIQHAKYIEAIPEDMMRPADAKKSKK